MSKHTPGPWQYRTIDGSIGGIEDAKGNPVGQSFAVLIEGKRNIQAIFKANRERIANAMLMAAAPELLEALQMVRDSTAVLNHLDSDAQQFICDVITKATLPD